MQFSSQKKILIGALVILAVFGGFFYFWQIRIPKSEEPFYSEAYRLVNDKVSQSASIRIYLPPGVGETEAKKNIKFYPEIEGSWEENSSSIFPVTFLRKI